MWGSVGRAVLRLVPAGIRRRIDDRFFYAIFHMTRGTNDHYPQPAEPEADTHNDPESPPESS